MILHLELGPELEAKLQRRAALAGKDAQSFALAAVERELARPETLAEILAPIHQAVKESGMSEDEVDALLERALAESRKERKHKA